MSYCRWSTDIHNTVPWEELLFLAQNNVPDFWEYSKKLQTRRGGETSDWYIFDNVSGSASIWHVETQVDWDYDELLQAYLYDRIEEKYNNPTQIEYMYGIVYEVLNNYYSEKGR